MSKRVDPSFHIIEFVGGPMDGVRFEAVDFVEQIAMICGRRMLRYECHQQEAIADPESPGKWGEVYRLVETAVPEAFDSDIVSMLDPDEGENVMFHRLTIMRKCGISTSLWTGQPHEIREQEWMAVALHEPSGQHGNEIEGETMADVVAAVWADCQRRGWLKRSDAS